MRAIKHTVVLVAVYSFLFMKNHQILKYLLLAKKAKGDMYCFQKIRL